MPSTLPAPFSASLTPKMIAFVDAYVRFGGKFAERSAIAAGYAPSGAAAIASRLLRRDDVLAYLRKIVETQIKADVVASCDTLRELRDNPMVAADVRRKAASELLDRAGLLIEKVSTVNHVVEHHNASSRPPSEMIKGILNEMLATGVLVVADPHRWAHFLDTTDRIMLAPPKATDAEFEEVEETPPEIDDWKAA